MIYIYDVVIIGAGPAGLAAGSILQDCGMHYLILEKGKNLPDRDSGNPCDISSGVGGCGLCARRSLLKRWRTNSIIFTS